MKEHTEKRKPGRKPRYHEPMVKVTVTMPVRMRDIALGISGDENCVSAGIREAINRYGFEVSGK